MSGDSKVFRERLRELREQKGWSQGHLSARTGLSQSYLSQLEIGVREPSFAALKLLAQAFGLTVSTFMEEA